MKKTVLLSIVFAFLTVACKADRNPVVLIETDAGNMEAEIFIKEAPITGTNFMNHVDSGTYNSGACFYRVVRMDNQPNNEVKIEVVQCGLYHGEERFPPIAHETTEMTGIKHTEGTLSMARWGPGTATTEFSICIGDQPELDYQGKRNPDGQGFAAFGRVIKGMDVARKIQQLEDSGQYLVHPVAIRTIRRIR